MTSDTSCNFGLHISQLAIYEQQNSDVSGWFSKSIEKPYLQSLSNYPDQYLDE